MWIIEAIYGCQTFQATPATIWEKKAGFEIANKDLAVP